MSGLNGDHLHRSTLGIYSSLIDEFNPSLLKLVSLGHSYVQAFKALATTSEAYFSALSKIGQNALNTMSSRSLGDVLIQISENQRRLTSELEGMFLWFNTEVLQNMENNVRLDRDYLTGSRVRYEKTIHNQERQLSRGAGQDFGEYERFLKESHSEALKEEERRFRFLAEKHCNLTQSVALLMNKAGENLQHRANVWTEEISATRQPPALERMGLAKDEEMRRGREEMPLGNIPSRAPSPQGSISRFSGDSGGVAGEKTVRAKATFQPTGVNPSQLTFTKGQMITVLVHQAKNGWLYGRADNGARKGWFPASYVEMVDDPPSPMSSRNSTPRGSNISLRSLLDPPPISNTQPFQIEQQHSQGGGAAPPPPPPPPQFPPPSTPSHSQPSAVRKAPEPQPEKKRPEPQHSRPELFPRGTNPFATVKLKPTSTNDRSAPHLYRR